MKITSEMHHKNLEIVMCFRRCNLLPSSCDTISTRARISLNKSKTEGKKI